MAKPASAHGIEGDASMANIQGQDVPLEVASRSMDMHIDGKYEVWLVLDTNTLMESPEELLSFHSASKDSILPKSGAFKNIDLSISYFIAQAVIRELDSRKQAGHSDDSDGNIAKKARNAARLLDGSELGQITFESTNDRSKAEMCLPEMLQDAALSRADHQLLVAAKYMQDYKFRSDQRNRVVIITDDVNLRNTAKGEGIMAVPSPSELPKKRKDFLPKMFPDLPEDSAAARMAARRAKYADNPELDALKKGLSTSGRRKPAPSQQEEYWTTPTSQDAADSLRNFDALYATMRVGGGSGPVVLNGPNRNNSGTPIQHGMHAAGAPGQHDTLQASRSLTKSTEAQQQGGLPSAAQIMRILILGLQPSLEQYLPHLSPATCQQDMEVLGSPQGLLACIFRHKVQLLEAPDSSACASSLLFLIKWAVEPQVRSPQEATAALTAVSIILKQFREPSTDGPARQALHKFRMAAAQAAVQWGGRGVQEQSSATVSQQAVLPSLGPLSISEAPWGSGGFYINGQLRGNMVPSPFQQPEEPSSRGAASGQIGRPAGSQPQHTGENLQALQMLQARALQQQQQQHQLHQQMQKQQEQARDDQSARHDLQTKLLQQHFQQQQQQEASSPHALSQQAYQQQLHAALQQRQASLASLQQQESGGPSAMLSQLSQEQQQQLHAVLQQRQASFASQQQETASPHATLSQEQPQQQQLQAALQQRRSSASIITHDSMGDHSPHGLAAQQLRMSHSQERQHQQSPSPHALQQQLHMSHSQERQYQQSPSPHALQQQQQQQQQQQAHEAETPHQQPQNSLQQLLQQHQAMLQQQREQQQGLDQRHSSHSEAGQHMEESDHSDVKSMPGSRSQSYSSQQAGSNLRDSMSGGSAPDQADGSPDGPPKGAKTAALVQGVLEELTRTGPQRRHAAKVMLDSLLNVLASMHPQDEEDAQLRQAHQAAVQVLWARMLHMNGVDMEEIKKGQADMEDVFAYLTSNGREQAKQDATALLNEVFME